MNKTLLGLLLAGTALAVAAYPALPRSDSTAAATDPVSLIEVTQPAPVIDVVFVLDTTGSMSGLIQAAKEKIWSIASTMASAKPAPQIRIGLVAYRDRGDDYITRTVDLNQDLDAIYAELMQFSAGGGGDGPESVNAALAAAVDSMSWSAGDDAYRVIFLVGDAPPHMDYQDERQYPEILAAARQRGIVVNAIQCGALGDTVLPWQQIARLGAGNYFQVDQAGSAVATATPFDAELAELTARLDRTRVFFGSREERAQMSAKLERDDKTLAAASEEAKARRGIYALSSSGKASRLGENELVDAVASGRVSLDELEPESLPAAMRPMSPEEQERYVDALSAERKEIESRMQALADQRKDYIREELEASGDADDSLDQKLYETISRQAVVAGLEYEDGPAY